MSDSVFELGLVLDDSMYSWTKSIKESINDIVNKIVEESKGEMKVRVSLVF